MTWIKLVLLGFQMITALIQYLERQRLIKDGERQQIAREMAKTAALMGVAKQVREEIGRMSRDEVDDALRDDFRD